MDEHWARAAGVLVRGPRTPRAWFGHALLKPSARPKGRISTHAEVRLKDADGNVSIPDGAVVVERGKTRWSTLVEVKTATAHLDAD